MADINYLYNSENECSDRLREAIDAYQSQRYERAYVLFDTIARSAASAPTAKSYLGYMYYAGLSVPNNIAIARDYYEQSAAEGNAFAKYELCKILISKDALPEERTRGMTLLQELASANHEGAILTLGDICKNQGNYAEAENWYYKAAVKGNPYACIEMVEDYLGGKYVCKTYDDAIQFLKQTESAKNLTYSVVLGHILLAEGANEKGNELIRTGAELAKKVTFNEYFITVISRIAEKLSPNAALELAMIAAPTRPECAEYALNNGEGKMTAIGWMRLAALMKDDPKKKLECYKHAFEIGNVEIRDQIDSDMEKFPFERVDFVERRVREGEKDAVERCLSGKNWMFTAGICIRLLALIDPSNRYYKALLDQGFALANEAEKDQIDELLKNYPDIRFTYLYKRIQNGETNIISQMIEGKRGSFDAKKWYQLALLINKPTQEYADCLKRAYTLGDSTIKDQVDSALSRYPELKETFENCNYVPEKKESRTVPLPDVQRNNADLQSYLDELNKLIGLQSVKKEIRQLAATININNKRKAAGLPVPVLSNHLVFSGNPGTGKTTVARLLAKIYKELGVVSKGQMIETDREGLVGQYVGETAIKTKAKIESALGGILFIDEAYSLYKPDSSVDSGTEAIDTLLKAMEDYRDDFVVVVAGYPQLMEQFLEANPGLKSRFNKFVDFQDYSPSELEEIFKLYCKDYQLVIDPELQMLLPSYFEKIWREKDRNFGNARVVRNIFEDAIAHQAVRLSEIGSISDTDLRTLTVDDFFGDDNNKKKEPSVLS